MGKGGGKGGGGGGQAPEVPVPAGLYQTIASTSGLGGYASSLLNPIASMTNWAANLASGGHAGQIPAFGTVAQQAGPQVSFGGRGALWNTSFDPTNGLVTFTNPKNPRQTFVQAIMGGASGGNLGDLPHEVIDQWKAEFAAHQGGNQGAGEASAVGSALPATASQIPQASSIPTFQQWYGENVGKTVYINGKLETIGQTIDANSVFNAYANNSLSWGAPDVNTALGPFLSSAWNAIQAQEKLPGQMAPIEGQTADLNTQAAKQATDLYNQAQPMYDQANQMIARGQAMLEQARASGDEGLIAQGQQMIQQGNTMLSNAQDMFSRANDIFAKADTMFAGADQIAGAGSDVFAKGTAMVNEATSGTGLFPSQAAYIEQIRKQGETQSAAELARLGLSESTMAPQLREQADLAAAGTAGQLIQGNIAAAEAEQQQGISEQQTGLSARAQAIAEQQGAISEQQTGLTAEEKAIAEQQAGVSTVTSGIQARQEAQKLGLAETGLGQAQLQAAQQQVQLGQASQKIALGAQALEVGEQQAVFDMFTGISNESTAFQRNLWDEAMQGYGTLGQIIQTSAQAYNYSLGGYKTVVDALAATAQNQEEAQKAQMQSDSQATSGLFGALGKILSAPTGGGGSSGGGGGSAIGSIIGLVGSVLTMVFCWVAREVYGADSPKWIMFADWMKTDAPRWLYSWYKTNGQKTAEWVKDKPFIKAGLRLIMDMILFIYA